MVRHASCSRPRLVTLRLTSDSAWLQRTSSASFGVEAGSRRSIWRGKAYARSSAAMVRGSGTGCGGRGETGPSAL
jgi:hypothetical protein